MEKESFSFIEEGKGEPVVLLHGLLGTLSNWSKTIDVLAKKYRVIVPELPILSVNIINANLNFLLEGLENFLKKIKIYNPIIIGNSLGGHIALMYALRNPKNLKKIVLTGSSGLLNENLGGSFPKRSCYNFIDDRVRFTFYERDVVRKDFVDEIYKTLNEKLKTLLIVRFAKSAHSLNLATELNKINVPTLLVWGLNDPITPVSDAYMFHKLIKTSKLKFIDKCCHAPMMERPVEFNRVVQQFLETEI